MGLFKMLEIVNIPNVRHLAQVLKRKGTLWGGGIVRLLVLAYKRIIVTPYLSSLPPSIDLGIPNSTVEYICVYAHTHRSIHSSEQWFTVETRVPSWDPHATLVALSENGCGPMHSFPSCLLGFTLNSLHTQLRDHCSNCNTDSLQGLS